MVPTSGFSTASVSYPPTSSHKSRNDNLIISLVNPWDLEGNGRHHDVTYYVLDSNDTRRTGEGMSKLDTLCSLFETIISRSLPQKPKALASWALPQSIPLAIRMRGQLNSWMSYGCNPFQRLLMTMRRGSLLSQKWIALPVPDRSSGGQYHVINGGFHLMIFSLPHWVAFWAVGELCMYHPVTQLSLQQDIGRQSSTMPTR